MGDPFGVVLPENLGQNLNDSPNNNEQPGSVSDSPVVGDLQKGDSATQKIEELLDLDKSDQRLRLNGREYSKQELIDSILRQDDYSKKTKALSEQRKYVSNFPADLASVVSGQYTLEQLKGVYGKGAPELVKIAEALIGKTSKPEPKTEQPAAGSDIGKQIEAILESKLAPLFENQKAQAERERQTAIEAAGVELDSIFKELETKYPEANSELISARLETAMRNGYDVLDGEGKFKKASIEKLFEKSHAETEERFAKKYGDKVKNQKTANSRGIDSGRGGGTPGQAPKKLTSLKDVRRQIEDDIDAGRLN